jgi:hypothetical protein
MDKISNSLSALEGAKSSLESSKSIEEEELKSLKAEQEKHQKAGMFLMSELEETRAKAVQELENVSTMGMQLVYGPEYKLSFAGFQEKRKEQGTSSYQMEMRIDGVFDGHNGSFLVKGGKGGGVQDTVSFILRDIALQWRGYNDFLVFDETFKYISRDDKVEGIAELMRHNSHVTGRQYIFATHMQDSFQHIANRIIKLSKDNGVACVSVEDKVSEGDDDER